VTMDELWWLLECVEKYKKVYMMAENYCYIPENQLIKSMVEKVGWARFSDQQELKIS
jgi:hypothetical protein